MRYFCNTCKNSWEINSKHMVNTEPDNYKTPIFKDKLLNSEDICPSCGSEDVITIHERNIYLQ